MRSPLAAAMVLRRQGFRWLVAALLLAAAAGVGTESDVDGEAELCEADPAGGLACSSHDGAAVSLLQRRGDYRLSQPMVAGRGSAQRASVAEVGSSLAVVATAAAEPASATPADTGTGGRAAAAVPDWGGNASRAVVATQALAGPTSRPTPSPMVAQASSGAGEAAASDQVSASRPLLVRCHRATRPLAKLDVLKAAAWTWPEQHSPKWLFALAGAYSTLPAVVAYGLPALFSGLGTIEVLSVAAFWAVVRPAAGALEVLQRQLPLLGETPAAADASCPAAADVSAAHAATATAAHFYWTWGLLELAVRRRPLVQRVGAVALLGAFLLPIPWAQVLLRDRFPKEAAADALLGTALGVLFFLLVHLPFVWHGLKASRLLPRDNLATFWGGALWPPERRLRHKRLLAVPRGGACGPGTGKAAPASAALVC